MSEPGLLHDPACGTVGGRGHADDALEPMFFEAKAERSQCSFSGQTAPPPGGVQLEPHLDLVDVRPVLELIEADSAHPAASGLLDSRPRAEALDAPLSQAVLREPDDSVRRAAWSAPDGRVSQEALKILAIPLDPRSQDEAFCLNGSHVSGAAECAG